MLELNKVHLGDCLELMKLIPDKSIDLVLTDPPYGDGIGYGRMGKEIQNNEDESINYLVIPELYKKMKDDSVMYIFTNWKFENKLRQFIDENTNLSIRMLLVIVKNNIGMGYGFRNQYELCIVCEKGKAKYHRNDVSNVLYMDHILHDQESHPHEKGIGLLKKLIDNAIGDHKGIVLDVFGGSGSTAVAAKQLQKDFILIELEQKYVDIANKRLANTTISLF